VQTDLEAYHFQAQSFLHDWICSSDVITYTLKGRAWNANKGARPLLKHPLCSLIHVWTSPLCQPRLSVE